MQEIGQELKQAREEKGLTLETISGRTMIAKKYLRALEEGDFNVFPGEVYLKGALRKVAGELDLDAEPLIARYKNAQGEKEEIVKTKSTSEPTAKPAPAPPAVKVYRSRKRFNTSRFVLLVLVIALLVFGMSAVIGVLNQESVPAVDVPPATDDNQAEDPPAAETPVIPDPQPAEVRVERDADQDGIVYLVYNAETVEVELSFTQRCWVGMETDTTPYYSDTFDPSEKHTLTFNENASIRLGNPPGVTMNVNGVSVLLPDRERAYTMEIYTMDIVSAESE
ncbi:MAG: DUF4115 domain-containing protein [Bacillota bacterium]|nr:DUF4115 domain-containing protein [Bacillota bacterium]MDW7682498.1 DUF4115 domain-containing protein [Bacillota bacterium]